MIVDPIDIEILRLLARGMVEKEIAIAINLSAAAVHKRIGKMMKKAQCAKSTRLVAFAFEQGILKIAV